jgi:hypothetical protein
MVSNGMKTHKNRSGMMKKGMSRPLKSKVKLNIDAAVNLDTRKASTECVIQDS